jgi:hypothetical protein
MMPGLEKERSYADTELPHFATIRGELWRATVIPGTNGDILP